MSLSYDVEASGITEYISRLDRFDDTADLYLGEAVDEALDAIAHEVEPLVPVFRGDLKNSLASTVTRSAGSIIGRYGSSIASLYPIVMELGRTPGATPPSVAAIESWVEAKLGDKRLAYVVARSIGRRGIRGYFFLKNGVLRAWGDVTGALVRGLDRIGKALAGND